MTLRRNNGLSGDYRVANRADNSFGETGFGTRCGNCRKNLLCVSEGGSCSCFGNAASLTAAMSFLCSAFGAGCVLCCRPIAEIMAESRNFMAVLSDGAANGTLVIAAVALFGAGCGNNG